MADSDPVSLPRYVLPVVACATRLLAGVASARRSCLSGFLMLRRSRDRGFSTFCRLTLAPQQWAYFHGVRLYGGGWGCFHWLGKERGLVIVLHLALP